MLYFITQNWLMIIISIGIIAYIGYLIIQNKWSKLRELAYQTMLLIEKEFTELDGAAKFEILFKSVYNKLPLYFQIIFPGDKTKEYLKEKLQEWYDIIKDWADDGEINGSSKMV